MDSSSGQPNCSVTADISAAIPPLSPSRQPPNSTGGENGPSQQPDIIMNPTPNRVKRFIFKSRKKQIAGSYMEFPFSSQKRHGSPKQGPSGQSDVDILEVVVPEVNRFF